MSAAEASRSRWATHEVVNQPPPLADYDPQARRLVEDMALALQASLLLRHSPAFVSSAFCAGRLEHRGLAFGDLPASVGGPAILERALAL